jgi:hypothetical protein
MWRAWRRSSRRSWPGEVAAKAAESDDKGEKSDKGDDKRQAKS